MVADGRTWVIGIAVQLLRADGNLRALHRRLGTLRMPGIPSRIRARACRARAMWSVRSLAERAKRLTLLCRGGGSELWP
jgi:hypothetical protein